MDQQGRRQQKLEGRQPGLAVEQRRPRLKSSRIDQSHRQGREVGDQEQHEGQTAEGNGGPSPGNGGEGGRQ